MLQSADSWPHQLMLHGEARVSLQPGASSNARTDATMKPGRCLLQHGGESAPSLLASGQGWERVCHAALPESPPYLDPAVPDAPAEQPPVPPGVLEALLAMYEHEARTLQLESGDLAALAAAAGNAAAVAVLSAAQNASQSASVRLLALIPHHATKIEVLGDFVANYLGVSCCLAVLWG